MRLAYNGAPFHGWQSQPNAESVQSTIERAMTTIMRCEVKITGAGRTDTGVNARVMYAHFDSDYIIPDKRRFLTGLNRLCGHAIAVEDVFEVDPDKHARFDARLRTYKYFVTFAKCPFLENMSWQTGMKLDLDLMNDAAALLLTTDDFTSFAKLHSDARTNICRVSEARWETWRNSFGVPGAVFTISADRFLRNMVRAVVGTLVDVGRGKISVAEFAEIIRRKDRCAAGTSMPPQALFLWDIEY